MDRINILIDKIKEITQKINNISFLNRTPSKKFIIIAFALIISVIGIFSAFTVIDEKKNEVTELSGTTATDDIVTVIDEKKFQELNGNFLLVLTQDGNKKIELIAITRLDSENNKVSISFISPEEKTSVNGFLGTMQEHLENGGINELVWSVGEFADISIERYIFGDEQNFIDLMKSLGDIQINISDKINYTHRGIPIVIEKGVQSPSADIMLKYFVYLCENYKNIPEKLAETMIVYGKNMFDHTSDEDLDQNFSKMLKHFNTDISVVDFTNYRKAIKNLASSENQLDILIEADPSNMK